jgi:transcriptional regulator with XRE-family HTH domain
MNASVSIFKTNESFVIKNVEPCMTQPISLIAKSLVRERSRTGLSLAEVARRAGIAKSTLSQLESGNGNPSLETLWALCVALDIPLRSCWSRRRKRPGIASRRRNQSGGRTGPLPGDFAGDLPAGRPP